MDPCKCRCRYRQIAGWRWRDIDAGNRSPRNHNMMQYHMCHTDAPPEMASAPIISPPTPRETCCNNRYVMVTSCPVIQVEDETQFWVGTFRVRSTLKSAWILTLVLKSAWIWSKPWKLHKILEKCLNYSISSLNFLSCRINEISHSIFCIVIIYVEMSITLCFSAEFIFFWFSFNLVRRATG